jgi:hypothetical protein
MDVSIRDVDASSIDDVFRICSFKNLDDPLQTKGMEIKRRWLLEMLGRYGPCTKIAYLDDRPVAQILFYPEEAVPYVLSPREGAVILHCAYNPFPTPRAGEPQPACSWSLSRNVREAPDSWEAGDAASS